MWTRLDPEIVWPRVPIPSAWEAQPRREEPKVPLDRSAEQSATPILTELETAEVSDEPTLARTARLLGGVAVEKA